ncbi:MAG: hypothetical protein LBT08_05550 [Synergistaceae bacterium]|nr:hypothetical protein [Synergistaceae bacterium]
MKRILSACLEQTIKFESEEEHQAFIANLNRKGVKHKVVGAKSQPDNSVMVKLIRDYNRHPIGDYFD